MPAKAKLSARASRASLITIGASATALLALLSFTTELANAVDAVIVTEAEFRDFNDQLRVDNLEDDIVLLGLQLRHETDPNHRKGLEAQRKYKLNQLAFLECMFDPRNNPEQCDHHE